MAIKTSKPISNRKLVATPPVLSACSSIKQIRLKYLLEAYASSKDKDGFFLDSFERIAGNGLLRKQIQQGWNSDQIRASWEPKLSQFKKKRKQYLLYPDE